MVLVIIRNPDVPLQTGRVLRGGRHALIDLLAAKREAGVNHVVLNLKPTGRDALDLFKAALKSSFTSERSPTLVA